MVVLTGNSVLLNTLISQEQLNGLVLHLNRTLSQPFMDYLGANTTAQVRGDIEAGKYLITHSAAKGRAIEGVGPKSLPICAKAHIAGDYYEQIGLFPYGEDSGLQSITICQGEQRAVILPSEGAKVLSAQPGEYLLVGEVSDPIYRALKIPEIPIFWI